MYVLRTHILHLLLDYQLKFATCFWLAVIVWYIEDSEKGRDESFRGIFQLYSGAADTIPVATSRRKMNRNLEKKKQNIYDRIGVVCDHFKPSSKIVHAEK